MIAIVVSGFFLYAQLVRTGDRLLGLTNVVFLLGFFLLVEPHFNGLLPIRRVQIFDENPPLLFLFASGLLSFVSAIVFLGESILFTSGRMIQVNDSILAVARHVIALFITGLILQFTWPYLKEMDLTIDVTRVEDRKNCL